MPPEELLFWLENPWFWTIATIAGCGMVLGYFAQSLARQFRGYHRLRQDLDQERQLLYRMLGRVLPADVQAALIEGADVRRVPLGRVQVVRVQFREARAAVWLRLEARLRRIGCYPAQHLSPESRLYYYRPAAHEPDHIPERLQELYIAEKGLQIDTAVGEAELHIEGGLLPVLRIEGEGVEKVQQIDK